MNKIQKCIKVIKCKFVFAWNLFHNDGSHRLHSPQLVHILSRSTMMGCMGHTIINKIGFQKTDKPSVIVNNSSCYSIKRLFYLPRFCFYVF